MLNHKVYKIGGSLSKTGTWTISYLSEYIFSFPKFNLLHVLVKSSLEGQNILFAFVLSFSLLTFFVS